MRLGLGLALLSPGLGAAFCPSLYVQLCDSEILLNRPFTYVQCMLSTCNMIYTELIILHIWSFLEFWRFLVKCWIDIKHVCSYSIILEHEGRDHDFQMFLA